MTERDDRLGPESVVMLMLGIVLGSIAAALSFTLGRRNH
jgi:hypothetical protein